MTSNVKLRKAGLVDYETQIKEVRCQLGEQLKVLDVTLEQKSQQLQDLSDYLRRRGEIESEYARSLDKLAERFTSRLKRKEPSGNSVAQVWLALLSHTRQESKDHSGLSESCSNFLIQPLSHCLEYTQRLAKKSKDICMHLQDGLLKVTTEMQTAWRTYYQYHSEYVCAEGKLKDAEKQEEKQKQSAAKKLERLIEKRQGKVQEIYLKCSKARNEYLLNLAAANSSMKKYYICDISTLIDCADAGYHLSLAQVMQAYLSGRTRTQQNLGRGLQQLQDTVSALDQVRDRDTLLQEHNNTFCMPLRFSYQPHDGDQISEVIAECEVRFELETRYRQIQSRLKVVSEETDEVFKGMSAAQSSLLENIGDTDLDPGSGSSLEGSTENLLVKPSVARRRANLQEVENVYITRAKEYLVGSSLVCKLQAKHDQLKAAVEKAEAPNGYQQRLGGKTMRIRKNHSSSALIHNHKLFFGDMLSFIQATGQQVPVIVQSCICFINLHGLHHEGIFRVPGSQMEINSLRDAFERGEDPLAERKCDLDSVAGVLKLYFRSLESPLVPIESTSQLLEHAHIKNEAERAAQLRAVISSFPEPVVIVMRYLFAFLHHVTEYSDENMMQSYNLAVCFGPSLVRCGKDDDAVTLQPQINALVNNIIVQHESIFPSQRELQGLVYEKCMTLEQDDCEPIIEEGEAEVENTLGKDGASFVTSLKCLYSLERGTTNAAPQRDALPGMQTGNSAESSPAAVAHKRNERPRSNSSSSGDRSRFTGGPAGGSIGLGGKFVFPNPVGSQYKPWLVNSPGSVHKQLQHNLSLEDIPVQVDKDVCHHMDSVFKELLSRQAVQTASSSASPPSGQVPQRKGRWDGRSRK